MMQFLFTKTPLAYFVASFWRDEAFSYLMARLPIHTLLWSTAQDANPPLYYLLLKLWMGLFGGSEVALRSLSLVFFWATIYVVYLILKNIYKVSAKKSLLYLLLFIGNPLLHYYAFEARMYSMTAFLATLLFYVLMGKKYRLYAYVALAALYTHYFLFIVVIFQAAFIFVTTKKDEKKHFFLPLIKASAWYVPWLVLLTLAKPPVAGSFWVAYSQIQDIILLPAIVLTGYEKDAWIVVPFLSTISLAVSGIIIFGSIHHFTRVKKLHFFLLLGWAIGIPLGIFILSFVKPVFLPRYLIFATVGLTILLIVSFESIKNNYIRAFSIGLIVFYLFSYSTAQVLLRVKAPLNKLYHSINKELRPTDVIYVTHEYDFHPAEYYAPKTKVYMYKKTYEDIPWFVGKVLIDKNAFRSSLPRYPERAFIINNDGTYTIQSSF